MEDIVDGVEDVKGHRDDFCTWLTRGGVEPY